MAAAVRNANTTSSAAAAAAAYAAPPFLLISTAAARANQTRGTARGRVAGAENEDAAGEKNIFFF